MVAGECLVGAAGASKLETREGVWIVKNETREGFEICLQGAPRMSWSG